MRWLVVTPEYPPHRAGGMLRYYELKTAALSAAGAEVSVVVSTPYSSFDDYVHQGVSVRFVPLADVNRHADRLTHLSAAPTFRRWIAAGAAAAEWVQSNAGHVDLIETTDFGLLFAALAGMPDRPPLVVTLHGSIGQISEHEPVAPRDALDSALARLTEAAVLPCADALHAYSPANAAEWAARLGRRVDLVPAPLPLPLGPEAAPEGDFTGAVVARIQPWKGPELLCRAIRGLGPSVPPGLKIAWVGRDTSAGPDGRSMSAWLAENYSDVWGRSVVPIGPRSATEVAALMASARFVVVPSSWDTFNYTLAEAMAHGSVTIGSTGAGASYLIEHGRNGFRFEGDDPQALANWLLYAHSLDEAERRAIGAAARATVASELDPRRSAAAALAAVDALDPAQRPEPPAPWIRSFFEPDAGRHIGPWGAGHLENVSIRELASHLKTRIARKIVG